MGTSPQTRHAGTCLEKDPTPAGCPPGHLSVTQEPCPRLEGMKGMSPVLSLHLSPAWCRSQGHTGHDPREPGPLRPPPCPPTPRPQALPAQADLSHCRVLCRRKERLLSKSQTKAS